MSLILHLHQPSGLHAVVWPDWPLEGHLLGVGGDDALQVGGLVHGDGDQLALLLGPAGGRVCGQGDVSN